MGELSDACRIRRIDDRFSPCWSLNAGTGFLGRNLPTSPPIHMSERRFRLSVTTMQVTLQRHHPSSDPLIDRPRGSLQDEKKSEDSDPSSSMCRIDSLEFDAITHLEQSANREEVWGPAIVGGIITMRALTASLTLTQDPICIGRGAGQRHLLFSPPLLFVRNMGDGNMTKDYDV